MSPAEVSLPQLPACHNCFVEDDIRSVSDVSTVIMSNLSPAARAARASERTRKLQDDERRRRIHILFEGRDDLQDDVGRVQRILDLNIASLALEDQVDLFHGLLLVRGITMSQEDMRNWLSAYHSVGQVANPVLSNVTVNIGGIHAVASVTSDVTNPSAGSSSATTTGSITSTRTNNAPSGNTASSASSSFGSTVAQHGDADQPSIGSLGQYSLATAATGAMTVEEEEKEEEEEEQSDA